MIPQFLTPFQPGAQRFLEELAKKDNERRKIKKKSAQINASYKSSLTPVKCSLKIMAIKE